MAFWNSQKLEVEIAAKNIVCPFRPERIKNCAYELSVGRSYYSTDLKRGIEIAPDGAQIIVPPGQLALLVTAEQVQIPSDSIGFISMKFSAKLRGLINVSGFHVDPGFHGYLKFAVYNAGSRPAIFTPGQALFQLWLADLNSAAEAYKGLHDDGNQIDHKDVSELQGNVASPAQLHSQIARLQNELRILEWIGGTLATAVVAVLLTNWFAANSAPVQVFPPGTTVVSPTRDEPAPADQGSAGKTNAGSGGAADQTPPVTDDTAKPDPAADSSSK